MENKAETSAIRTISPLSDLQEQNIGQTNKQEIRLVWVCELPCNYLRPACPAQLQHSAKTGTEFVCLLLGSRTGEMGRKKLHPQMLASVIIFFFTGWVRSLKRSSELFILHSPGLVLNITSIHLASPEIKQLRLIYHHMHSKVQIPNTSSPKKREEKAFLQHPWQ